MNKVAIFSTPRSGSSWLGQLFNSHPQVLYRFQPNFAYSFNYKLKENSTRQEIDEFYKNLIATNDDFVCGRISISSKKNIQFDKDKLTCLVFKETHFLNTIENLLINSDTKIIGIVRSPFAVINSWLKIPKEFNPDWDVKTQWKSGENKNEGKPTHYFGYNKWKEATQLFVKLKKEYPSVFYLAEYDKMLENPEKEIKKLFNFCELNYSKQTQEFLILSNKQNDSDPYAVIKKKNDDLEWKNELPEFIIEEIQKDKEFKDLNSLFQWI